MPVQPPDTSFGIDVSKWQGVIDWPLASGYISFAYIKASGGDGRPGSRLYVDPLFARNAAEATRVGKPWGPYHFAGGVESPEVEAQFFARTIQWTKYTLPPVLDWEPQEYSALQAVNWVLRFCAEFKRLTGVKPVIYTGYATPLLRDGRLLSFDLWQAAYVPYNDLLTRYVCQPWGRDGFSIWQYSSEGRVPGINGNVDCNFAKNSWLRKYTQPDLAPTPEEEDMKPVVLHTDTDKRYLWAGDRPAPAGDVQVQTAANIWNGGQPLQVVEVNEAFVSELLG